jgi:hypothetical protein
MLSIRLKLYNRFAILLDQQEEDNDHCLLNKFEHKKQDISLNRMMMDL